MTLQPYLTFDGRCEEALEFYRKTLDARVETLMRFKDHPPAMAQCEGPPPPADKVMHACVRIGDSTFMASDGGCMGKAAFQGFSLAYSAKDDADARRRFEALADGGKVHMPLAPTFFASSFGIVADKFGVSWMVVANA